MTDTAGIREKILDLRSDILERRSQLPDILRKAKILARALNTQEFADWVDNELTGYPPGSPLPTYRQAVSQTYGNFISPVGGFKSLPIPTVTLPKDLQQYATTLEFRHSVRELEGIVETGEQGLQFPWPADTVFAISKSTLQNHTCVDAWWYASASEVKGILDVIRTRLLNFILELEEIAGTTGALTDANSPSTSARITLVFNTTIRGDHNVVAAGTAVTQEVQQIVHRLDSDSLRVALLSAGLANDDIDHLMTAIKDDGNRTKDQGPGPKAKAWIGNMVQKAAKGGWSVAVETVAPLLTKAIAAYCGWT